MLFPGKINTQAGKQFIEAEIAILHRGKMVQQIIMMQCIQMYSTDRQVDFSKVKLALNVQLN